MVWCGESGGIGDGVGSSLMRKRVTCTVQELKVKGMERKASTLDQQDEMGQE